MHGSGRPFMDSWQRAEARLWNPRGRTNVVRPRGAEGPADTRSLQNAQRNVTVESEEGVELALREGDMERRERRGKSGGGSLLRLVRRRISHKVDASAVPC